MNKSTRTRIDKLEKRVNEDYTTLGELILVGLTEEEKKIKVNEKTLVDDWIQSVIETSDTNE